MEKFRIRASAVCPECSREMFYYPDEVADNKIYCDGCGTEIDVFFEENEEEGKKHLTCIGCGQEIYFDPSDIDVDFVFCQNCGKKNKFDRQDSKEQTQGSPFAPAEEQQIAKEAEKLVENMRKPDSIGSPFGEIKENEVLTDEAVMEKIHKRTAVWRDSIQDRSNVKSAFTDNFAHGMPDWDLTPPDFMVRRKAAKHNK